MSKLTKEELEAALLGYQQASEESLSSLEVQKIWDALEQTALLKVRRFIGWDDPEIIGDAISKTLLELRAAKGIEHPLQLFRKIVGTECLMKLRDLPPKRFVAIQHLREKDHSYSMEESAFVDAERFLGAEEMELLELQLEGLTQAEVAERQGKSRQEVQWAMRLVNRKLKENLRRN